MPPLSGWLLLEIGLADGVNSSIAGEPSGGIAAAKSSHLAMQKRFDKSRRRVVALASKTTINAVTNEACAVSGTTEINDDGLRADGTGVVVFTFRECVENGSTINGVMRMTIAAFDFVRGEPSDYTLQFENVRISFNSEVIEANGSARFVINGSTVTTTRNTVARYLPDNVYLRLQDFVEIDSAAGDVRTRSFSGRFYHSQYGYVDVQTPVTLSIEPLREYARFGRMLMTSGNARVELRFREQNALSIGVDVDGDGTVERGLSSNPSELLRPIGNFLPMADAGGDRVVEEGDVVTLDASGNRDWEGAPVSYSWTLVTPSGGAPSGAQGPTYTFTPPASGLYVVQLMVSDGSGSTAIDQVTVRVRAIPVPVANAGPTISTVERSTVTLDASGTTYPGGSLDTLQFNWTRIQAPAGSNAVTTLTGVRPQVAIDLPGAYEYRLSVTGRGGVSVDTVTIRASGVVRAATGNFLISPYSQARDTTYEMLINVLPGYTGPPLSLAISSDADWLTIDTPNVTISTTALVTVRLDLDVIESLPNGGYDTVVRISPAGYSEWTGQFHLQVTLPTVEQASPYVIYTGQQTTVNLLGDQLDFAAGWIVVNGLPALGVTRESRTKARVELPVLPAGEYTVRVSNALGLLRAGARLVVRNPPAHPNSVATLPGRPYSLEYDPERDAFYGVFYTDDSEYVARRFHRQGDGTWRFDPIVVSNPRALTLGLGGERVFVTTGNCTVYEIDPVTLQPLTSARNPGCVSEHMGLVAALADGEVLVAHTNEMSEVWRYPSFTQQVQLLPTAYSPIAVVSHDRSRMLWADSPALFGWRRLYVFDVLGRPESAAPAWSEVAVRDAGTFFSRSNLSISGDGSRFMHREDVYDNQFQYVGSLQGVSGPNLNTAMSRRGARAAVFNNETDELMLFDVSTGSSFPSLGAIDTFSEDVWAMQLGYFPDDTAVFMWATVQAPTEGASHRLFVRPVP